MKNYNKNQIFTLFASVITGLGLLFSAVPAQAISVIDFSNASGTGGVINCTSNTNCTGSGVTIDTLKLLFPASSYPVLNGSLDFSLTSSTNSISVSGSVPGLGLTTNQTLLTGTFNSLVWNSISDSIIGTGSDTKSAALLTAVGLPVNTKFDFYGWTLYAKDNEGVNQGYSTDISNHASVPEPSLLFLLGSGLIGLGLWGRKGSFQSPVNMV